MFEKICIKPTTLNNPTDIGFIAENLLYYQDVNVIVAPDTIPIFLNNCGEDTLIELLTHRNLNLYVRNNILGIAVHKDTHGENSYAFDLFSSRSLDREEVVFRGIFKSTGRRGYSKRIAQRIAPHIKEIEYKKEIYEHIKEDVQDSNYVNRVITEMLKSKNIQINITDIECMFLCNNDKYKFVTNFSNNGDVIDHSSLLLNIIETRGDVHLSASLNAEIATTDMNTSLMKIKFRDMYNKVLKNNEDLFQFNDFILNNGHAIREVINDGERTFTDFLKVLDKSDKFRDWLQNIDEKGNIIKEYHNAVTKETWVDKLPAKSFRWSFFTGAGLLIDLAATGGIATLVGLGLSLGDAFILDNLLKGWKPNIFVENKLTPFVNSSRE